MPKVKNKNIPLKTDHPHSFIEMWENDTEHSLHGRVVYLNLINKTKRAVKTERETFRKIPRKVSTLREIGRSGKKSKHFKFLLRLHEGIFPFFLSFYFNVRAQFLREIFSFIRTMLFLLSFSMCILFIIFFSRILFCAPVR